MNVGFVGLGKLGMVVALAIENKGHNVFGYDVDPNVYSYVKNRKIPYTEEGAPELLAKTRLQMMDSVEGVVAQSDIVFCPVQTPHLPMYEGITRIPSERADFDYTYLKTAVGNIAKAAKQLEKKTVLVVISTVLPGTIEREIKPLLNEYIEFAYEPLFIAMGTTRHDFENPEFVLLGMDESEKAINLVKKLHASIHDKPVFVTTVRNAELIKVVYNTFISSKIAYINTIMEICEKMGANIDEISRALSLATDRIVSMKYMWGGNGDGGGCFPFYERVMTQDGMKMICKIKEGDMVLTGRGRYRPVKKVWKREYDGDIIKVKVRGLPETHMTTEHPVLVKVDGRKRVPDGRRNTLHKLADKLQPERMVRADELGLDHLTMWPIHTQEPIGRDDLDFIELAGWFASEGSAELNTRRGRLRFDLHAKEGRDAKRIGELLEMLAVPSDNTRGANAVVSHKVEGNRRSVRFGNLGLTKKLVDFVGKGAKHKHIDSSVLNGTEDVMRTFLRGLIRGDGHRGKNGVSYSTISPDLAWGAYYIMHRLGLQPTLRVIPPRGDHKEAYEVRVRSQQKANELCYYVGWKGYGNPKDIQMYANTKHGTWRPVVGVQRDQYKGGYVYNLWVEDDNTYVVGCGVVHNCHPRDNIALSWLARRLSMRHDYFEHIMMARETQQEWFADLIEVYRGDLPVMVMGKTFKAETNLTVGSQALLLGEILNERGIEHTIWDPHTSHLYDKYWALRQPALYFISMNHREFAEYEWPEGSIVIDIWGYIPDREGVRVERIGRR